MASDDYAQCLQRGRHLLSELDEPLSTTTASPWAAFSDLAEQGWIQEAFGGSARFDTNSEMNTFRDDTAPHEFQDTSDIRNISWRYNAALYQQRYHPAGVIFATSLRSPTIAATTLREHLREPLPDLRHWSDVTFLQWTELTADVPGMRKKLQKVVHCAVNNPQTLGVVMEVLGMEGAMSLPFPGRSFTREGDEEIFAALLGTPNALGTGFLLAQHKEQLGEMVVESVQLYTDMGLFLVVNVGQKED